MNKRIQGIIVGILIGVLVGSVGVFASSRYVQKTLDYNNIKITLDGEELIPLGSDGSYVEPFIIDGVTYLPVRGIASALDLGVDWDGETKTVLLTTPETAVADELQNMFDFLGVEATETDTVLKFATKDNPDAPTYINVLLPNEALMNLETVITEIQTNGFTNFKEGDLNFHFEWDKDIKTATVKISPKLVFDTSDVK